MKSVLNIARAELRYMATSPIAWGVGFVLLVLFARDYINVLASYVGQVERGGAMDGLTYRLTVSCPKSAWMKNPFFFMGKFILPFLFMGVVSREFSGGTIRLIQSAPVSIRAMVWGKFLGLVGVVFILILVYSLLVLVCSFTIVAPEISLLLWQLVVLFLYFSFIASICLFASSLSSYALVGGVISIVIIIGTNLLNNVGQATALADFFYPLSHQAIGERLSSGSIDWNDLITLLVFTILFVMLAIVHLQNKSRNLSVVKRVLRVGMTIVAACMLIALLPYRPIAFIDIRRGETGTVHPNMQRMLGEFNEGPLEVTHYFNIIFDPSIGGEMYVPGVQAKTKYDVWRPYMRHKKDIRVTTKYYFAIDTADYYMRTLLTAYEGKSEQEIARIMADTYGYDLDEVMTLEEAQRDVDIKGNEYIGHIVKLAYQDRVTQVLGPGFYQPSDVHYYAAMERLLTGRGKEMFFLRDGNPREIYYRTPESEVLTNKQNQLITDNWIQTGPPQDSIRLADEDLPETAKTLVLLGPRQPISDTTLTKIKQHIDQGGNLWLGGEPAYREFVKPLMDYLGVAMLPGVIVQPTPNRGSAQVLGAFTTESYTWSRSISSGIDWLKFYDLSIDTFNLIMDGVMGLDVSQVSGFDVTNLVMSRNGRSWNKPYVPNYDSLQLLLDRQPSDVTGSFPLMVLLQREVNGRHQQILVSGDVDFIKGYNAYTATEGGMGREFVMDILTAFTDGAFPVDLKREFLPDKGFHVSMRGVRMQEIALVYILPGLLLMGGGYTILRRRRN